MSESKAFIITGRTILDWILTGHKELPADVRRLRCMFCGAPLTISAEGARRLAEHKRKPDFPVVGAACANCTKDAARHTPIGGIESTAAGAEVLERSQNARDLMQFLMERAK